MSISTLPLTPVTRVDIAKKAIHLVVASYTAAFVGEQIAEHTDHTSDEIIVKVPSAVTGFCVASGCRRFTDPAVDKIASKLSDRKTRRQEKKEAAKATPVA
jgi:hypothetical protein